MHHLKSTQLPPGTRPVGRERTVIIYYAGGALQHQSHSEVIERYTGEVGCGHSNLNHDAHFPATYRLLFRSTDREPGNGRDLHQRP